MFVFYLQLLFFPKNYLFQNLRRVATRALPVTTDLPDLNKNWNGVINSDKTPHYKIQGNSFHGPTVFTSEETAVNL